MVADPIARIERSLVTLVRRATDPRGNRQINALAGVDIDRSVAVMLARIEEHQPVRLSRLAELVGVDISTASRQVARLVDEGLVDREADPEDRRASVHQLTDQGEQLRCRLVVARRTWFERRLADFTADERAAFADLLERYVQGVLDADVVPGAQPASTSRSRPDSTS